MAFEEYYRARQEFLKTGQGPAPSRPTSALDFYSEQVVQRRAGNGVSAILTMFGAAKSGDIIVVPEPPWNRKVRLGEFVGGPEDRTKVALDALYPGSSASARSVRWLARVDEPRIPRPISDALRHQVAISDLGTDHILNLLDFAYGAYVFGKDTKGARVNTRAKELNEQDNLDLSLLIKLCSSIAWDAANGDDPDASLTRYVARILPDEANLYISSNINSPGYLNVKGSTFAPILLAALFTLSLTCDAGPKPRPNDVSVINSEAGMADTTAATIEQMLRQSMEYMGESDWKDLQARSKRLETNPKLSVASRGTIGP